ncbi:sulfite exporter TauE/SafE family protein [Acetonema longum]|uniref:Heavy metal transport/detoxification protein n=1 Tax=Acetonema longum DSM 6540 TaxID=1009370 RepID=F7NEU4_9FIRM|nr:sulfite exporter TauE/SafE family protein [Acetonema longum]EGO65505.1 heavy metal transport/detoxification protein [Acetonema longum DSM 6540]
MSLRSITIPVKDMHCTACEGRIENALKNLNGVLMARASFAAAEVTVTYDPALADNAMFAAAIEKSGYSIGKAPRYGKLLGLLLIFTAIFLLGNLTDAYDIDSQLQNNVSYFVLFSIGALTSLHCIGMCGGLMLSQSIRQEAGGQPGTLPALAYNIGRILSYTLLGGAAGALGSVFSLTLAMKAGITLFAGLFMILMGLNMAGLSPFKRFSIRWPWSGYAVQTTRRSPFVVGCLNGLMPCGPLQTMQLYALGTGSAVNGATAMFFFALGTVPFMLTIGSLSGFLSKGHSQKIVKFSGVLVLALGLIMADRGLALSGMELPGLSFFRANTTRQTAAIKAEIKDGVQIIHMAANRQGYVPGILYLQKGLPVQWIIDGEQLNACNNAIIIPALHIEKPLEPGENTVEFMPLNEKEINFSCWMGMIRGVFKVVDDLAAIDVSEEKPLPSSGGCSGSCCVRG